MPYKPASGTVKALSGIEVSDLFSTRKYWHLPPLLLSLGRCYPPALPLSSNGKK